MHKLLRKYLNSWWIPLLPPIISLVIFASAFLCLLYFPSISFLNFLPLASLIVLFISTLGILATSIYSFIKRKWKNGVISLILFFIFSSGIYLFLMFGMFFLFFFSRDTFADHLKIPKNIEISEPADWRFRPTNIPGEDLFQKQVISTVEKRDSDDSSITASINSLAALSHNAPQILRQYLAISPSWRVFQEKGSIFATRRWKLSSHWQYNLHGYYTGPDVDHDFQSRFTIGFSGKPWAGVLASPNSIREGETKELVLSTENHSTYTSQAIINSSENLVVESFEESTSKERQITKTALAYLEKELQPLITSPTIETIRKIIPSGSIRRETPSFGIYNFAFEPGIYESEIWANPGEPGMVYLKAFEVTKGTPLSAELLKEKSNEFIGWSSDSSELFFSNTTFTIYEGRWGKPYAARFEVWFAPDSGEPERKLMEKVYKIEGWER